MSLLTVVRKNDLKKNAMQQIGVLHKETNVPDKDLVIADIGANIGYYAESFLHFYPNSVVHAYEPHPLHIEELSKLNEARITVHPYGLWNCDKQMTIGMRSDGKMNNGTYGIFDHDHSIDVPFKNANNELIRPQIVKIDVEGSELFILECESFFEKTQVMLIELLDNDVHKMNDSVIKQLQKMRFSCFSKLGKNDYLWIRDVAL